jgi:hypothetical protein
MNGPLRPTTTQAARGFLGALGFRVPGTTAPGDVLALLTAKVRERRDDPAVRGLLRDLIASLDGDPARLPSPECESRDAQALARELEAIFSNGAQSKRGTTAPLVAAAALLVALCVGTGSCSKPESSPSGTAVTHCADDPSIEHFRAMVGRAEVGLPPAAAERAVARFDAENEMARKAEITRLCGMTPEEVTTYLTESFAEPSANVTFIWGYAGDTNYTFTTAHRHKRSSRTNLLYKGVAL